MNRRGASLLEFVMAMGLLTLLLQLLFPALSAAREAARQLQCMTHLRQIGAAAAEHHELHGRLPSGGWHFTWIGEPERGTGIDQPGGWAYNLLDYLDASSLRQIGLGMDGPKRFAALTDRCRTPLSVFHCPTRRGVEAYPQTWNTTPRTGSGRFLEPVEWAAKTDYAACVGDGPETEFDWRWAGPESLVQGDDSGFRWPDTQAFSGVIFGRSQIRYRQIRDGLTHTLLIAEKYLDAAAYRSGEDFGDNESLYNGFNNDSCRTTLTVPRRDTRGVDSRNGFGSAHPYDWQAVMCDGSVRRLGYDADASLVRQLGNRRDGAGVTAQNAGGRNDVAR